MQDTSGLAAEEYRAISGRGSSMKVLLTGATGFVGGYLYPALRAAGCEVRCATRDAKRAREAHPSRDWVTLDVEDPETIRAAMDGCDAAFYLIHSLGQGENYPEREAASAKNFLEAAESANLRRIVYLGGVLPTRGPISKHLASRRDTGERLRSGAPSTIELRAAMIMGAGSASWTMVHDLAARLPGMLLPLWLRNHSHPIAIDDVVWALLASLFRPEESSKILEIPGPERISHRDVLTRIAAELGHRRPMMNVPVLTPKLSSYWIALVTRIELAVAKELVEGVRYNLDPREELLWEKSPHPRLRLERAAALAVEDETSPSLPSPGARARAESIGASFAGAGKKS